MPKKSNNKTKTPFSGSHSDLLMELMYLLQELNERLLFSEDQESEIEQLSKFCPMILGLEEEFLESLEIPLSEELWEELCKALESDRIMFMGIA